MTQPITARHDLTIWRNDDYYEYPIRVVGLNLAGVALAMEVRLGGDVTGAPLISLPLVVPGTGGGTNETQGVQYRGVSTVDGVEVSDVRIRMDRSTLQALPYSGERGDAAEFEYALVIGGRTRLTGKLILPAHVYKSDAAPANRPASYGSAYSRQGGSPDSGASLIISLDGGVTVIIDGADIVSGAIGRAESAATRAEAAALTFRTASKVVSGYGDREDIPVAQRPYGLQRTVTNADGGLPRVFVWSKDVYGPGQDDWVGLKRESELLNRGNHTGSQNIDTINGLPGVIAGTASDIANLQLRLTYAAMRIDSFTVTPTQAELGSSVSSLALAWSYSGATPNGQSIERSDGQRVTGINPSERSVTAAALPVPAGVLVIGDSQPWEWAPEYASALGLTLANAARPAHTIRKQAVMVGADPLTLTIAGGSLPAAGTKATVTLVNGATTTPDNPDAILHSALTGVDSIQLDLAVTGGTRRCTLSHDLTNAPNVYKIEQAAGGAAVAVANGAAAVPTFKAMASTTHRVVIMAGHNDMLQNDPAGSFIGIRARTDSIMALCADNLNPVQLNDFWPAANAEEIALIPYIQAHSQWLRDKFPSAIAIDAAGRTLWERLRQSDKTIPEASRKPGDTLHLNATPGRTTWTAHHQEDNAAHRAAVAPATASATFTLRARGAIVGLPTVEATATATVTFLPRRFWGVSANDTLTSAQVIALAGAELSSSRAKTVTVNPAAQYAYVAYLASLGDPTGYKIGGFNEGYVKTTVSVTTAAGLTANYTVLRSLNKLSGAASVEVQ